MCFFIFYIYYKKTALRRLALKQLDIIEQRYLQQGNINQLAMSLNKIFPQD